MGRKVDGFTLLEVLLALCILLIGILGTISLVQLSALQVYKSTTSFEAAIKAQSTFALLNASSDLKDLNAKDCIITIRAVDKDLYAVTLRVITKLNEEKTFVSYITTGK